jgi:hypothetical protein
MASHYRPTPLLGISPRPPSQVTITRDEVSNMLDPLKKHLLIADSVYFRDSFYYCFDAVADSVKRDTWRDDPNVANLVRDSIRSLKDWLPILIELRDFIESGALVFMPYYLTPSFPYNETAPAIKEHYKRLCIRPDPNVAHLQHPTIDFNKMREALRNPPPLTPSLKERPEYFSESEAMTAWLNGRILGLDPVFPTRKMSDWAARLYFNDGPETADLSSDLFTIQLLPFGETKGLSLDQLWKMRKTEEVFTAVQRIVAECKEYIRKEVGTQSTKKAVSDACETFLRDHLEKFEKTSVLKFLKFADEKPAVGIVLSMAIGAALLPASPVIAAIATVITPFVTPAVARAVQNRFSPTRQAYGHLQALL